MSNAEKYPNLAQLARQILATGKPREVFSLLKAGSSLVKKD